MAYFQQLEERLIRSFISGWKRRGSSFLQIGVHSYIAPEFFWDAGFDVCAIDENINALNSALNSSGPRVEYQLGKADCLPFDDDSFDYVFFTCYVSPYYKSMKARIIAVKDNKIKNEESNGCKKSAVKAKSTHLNTGSFSLRVNAKKRIQANLVRYQKDNILNQMPTFLKDASFESLFNESSVFSEACRVGRKGIILLCKNSFSMQELPALGANINPWSLWKLAKQMFPEGKVQIATSLIVPYSIRKKFKLIDTHSRVFLFGGLAGICINFNAPVVTGLGVLTRVTAKEELIDKTVVNSTKMRNE